VIVYVKEGKVLMFSNSTILLMRLLLQIILTVGKVKVHHLVYIQVGLITTCTLYGRYINGINCFTDLVKSSWCESVLCKHVCTVQFTSNRPYIESCGIFYIMYQKFGRRSFLLLEY